MKERGRYIKNEVPSLKSWKKTIHNYEKLIQKKVSVQCGWGRVIFANTYTSADEIVEALKKENQRQRDIAFYIKDPHVISSLSPNEVFLDPSHSYRIWFENYQYARRPRKGINVRRLQKESEIKKVNQILKARGMIPLDEKLAIKSLNSRKVINLVAESIHDKKIVGFVTGLDHKVSFQDPEKGSSLWSLAVDPQCVLSGVGEALVRYLIEFFQARGNSYLDLSVMHHNQQAIQLYEKLHFSRVPVYCLKRKNTVNEKLYTPKKFQKKLNPYGQIIIDEAARRGINIDILDQEAAIFKLSHGSKVVYCREALSDLTDAVVMSQCADKRVTHKILKQNGFKVPQQITAHENIEKVYHFLDKYKSLVLKPATGEQGRGVKVGLTSRTEIKKSISSLTQYYPDLILEQMVSGLDIRVIVIEGKFVAAAQRTPPLICGNGVATVEQLIQKLNRRRMASTGGESRVPIDDETKRTLKAQRLTLKSKLKLGQEVYVRKTANLHTGGQIVDLTPEFPAYFRDLAEQAAWALRIPVVGLDFIIPKLSGKKYWILEANERPGLANHEPQPTAERFLDFIFPSSRKDSVDGTNTSG